MEIYRGEFQIEDTPCSFFDLLEELRQNEWISILPGHSCWLGKAYPSPVTMLVWLLCAPRTPSQFQAFVAASGLTLSCVPADSDLSVVWSEVFTDRPPACARGST